MSLEHFIVSASTEDMAAVRAVAPLAADRTMQCGPFTVPAAVVASEPTLEHEESGPARVLRKFLADDPWSGMGSVFPGGWMLLARDEDTMVFGQREGVVGMGKVVTLVKTDGQFRPKGMGGWRLCATGPRERVESSFKGVARGNEVTVTWMRGGGAAIPDRVLARLEILEMVDQVHFLLISTPNPDLPPWRPGRYMTALPGRSTSSTFRLSAPLDGRSLLNDFRVPATPVQIRTDASG